MIENLHFGQHFGQNILQVYEVKLFPPQWSYLLEGGPLYYRLPRLGEYSRNPSVSVYQLALLWEAVFSFSEFFWRLSVFAHFMSDLWAHLSTLHWVFSTFWPKTAWLSCPTQIHPRQLFFLFPQMKKTPQRETSCWCGRSETKNGRSTKRHHNQRVQKLFWAVGKTSR